MIEPDEFEIPMRSKPGGIKNRRGINVAVAT